MDIPSPDILDAHARDWRATLWRMVEAQHVTSTMKLVDSGAEHDLLEILIEGGKPPVPLTMTGLDYLLASPFRYPPFPAGSRFRGPTDPGVFYGAQGVRTAAAELGYWRWRFLQDSPALESIGPVAHTAFAVKAQGRAIDLRQPPLVEHSAQWAAPRDYAATQALGRAARDAGVDAVIYTSVRDPKPAWCAVLMGPRAFARPRPEPGTQSWWLTVTPHEAIWLRASERMIFETARWE
ncbi:RES family NAD+ phosphorylase [Uliginosibacterium sp. sgz301328]|uniref:RES family NAD+ phosphorylase n=1 Tax=Uliginosibacterium sp. sgz301328 TaxID=3243764 RepID=UPI00359EF214